jgi:hypothetical protein
MSHTEESLDRRTLAKVGVGFLVAFVLLYLFGRVIGWQEILQTLGSADPAWFAAAVASSLVGLAVWSKAWDEILALVEADIPFPKLMVTYFAATFADYVTPLGKAGGGPFIAYVLSTDERVNYEESLASVTTADLLNLLPFFGFAAVGFVGLLVRGGLPSKANTLVFGLAALAVAVPTGGYVGWRYRGTVTRTLGSVLDPIAERLPFIDPASVRETIRGFFTEVERIRRHPRMLAHTLVFSVTGWVFFAAPLYFAGRTLGVPLDPLVVVFIVPASTLAGLVPTPGGLGGVELAIAGLLVAFAPIDAGMAASIALVYRIASYWIILAVGGTAALYEIYTS